MNWSQRPRPPADETGSKPFCLPRTAPQTRFFAFVAVLERALSLGRREGDILESQVLAGEPPSLLVGHELEQDVRDLCSYSLALLENRFDECSCARALDSLRSRFQQTEGLATLDPWKRELLLEKLAYVCAALMTTNAGESMRLWMSHGQTWGARLARPDLASALDIQAASLMVGRGLYSEAGHALQALESRSGPLPGFWALRASLLQGICAQAQARFEEARSHLVRQEALLQHHDSTVLRLGLLRRRLSLEIESESYAEARFLYENARDVFLDARTPPFFRALFALEESKLMLADGRTDEARHSLEAAIRIARETGIPPNVIALWEARCELGLLSDDPGAALAAITEAAREASGRSAFNSYCLLHFLRGRALCLQGRLAEAGQALRQALEVAERHRFGRDRFRIEMQLLACRLHSGEPLSDVDFRRLGEVAGTWGLKAHRTLCLLLEASCTGSRRAWNCLHEVSDSLAWFRYARILFGVYGFAHLQLPKPFHSEDGESFDPLAFVDHLLASSLVGYVKQSRLLIESQGGALRMRILDEEQRTHQLLHRMFSAGKRGGVTLEELHALCWPGVTYRSERHAHRIYVMISSANQTLQDWNSRLRIRRVGAQRYSVASGDSPIDMVRLAYAPPRIAARAAKLRHEESILELLHRQGNLSGAALARELGIARQSLNPTLVRMVDKGLLLLEGRGRSARYALAPESQQEAPNRGMFIVTPPDNFNALG